MFFLGPSGIDPYNNLNYPSSSSYNNLNYPSSTSYNNINYPPSTTLSSSAGLNFPRSRFGSMTMGNYPYGGGMYGPDSMSANIANLLNDKDNFQVNGCGFDATRNRCFDSLNLCKGGCRDFGVGVAHDCRCIPYAILALLGYKS
ncbi:unnamed protein product [Anisakis simplex]|uniref:Uncharacterized protein n=1 Tax=Anisakis simplex TaxID=6269 RepID=A0A3P6PMP0_ANISI|nr:unnamed protein product [Anisakis simplex]